MTGDTVRSTGGAVHLRRNRASSLAAPTTVCDLKRSLSDTPEFIPRPRARNNQPHARSQSVKIRKTRTAPDLDPANNRWYCYRVRSFHLSSKGLVNRGDSVRYRQTKRQLIQVQLPIEDNGDSDSSLMGVESKIVVQTPKVNPDPDVEKYRIQLVGGSGVGKTALSNQFLTSEHIFVRSSLPEVSCGEETVTILLNGIEAQITFIDGFTKNTQQQQQQGDENPLESDCFLVVYSVASEESFEHARKILTDMRNKGVNKAAILVGNKSDLVRARTVSSEDGRNLASLFNVKFIETSVGINHNVDELLVGSVAQMRLKQRGKGKSWPNLEKASFRVRKFLHRLMGKDEPTPPCDILHKL